MRRSLNILSLALPALLSAQTITKEFPHADERELVVIVDVSFGTLVFERAPRGMAAVVQYEEENYPEDKLHVTYETGSRAKLRIRSKSTTSVFNDKDRHNEDRRIVVRCTDQVPLSFDVELGAGRGELNLTGMKIQEFRVSTGASDVRLWCDTPNPITADNVEIESGVSKFTAENMSNLNFRKLVFNGGVGSYRLDFGGELRQDAEVDIDVGLGSVIVDLPEDLQARLHYDDHWFSTFRLDGDFHKSRSGIYETTGHSDSRYLLDIRIDSGLGSVKIRRR